MPKTWKWRYIKVAFFLSSLLCIFNFYALFKILSPKKVNYDNFERIKNNKRFFQQDVEDGEINFVPETSMCSFRTVTYVNGEKVQLNLPPFDHFTKSMECLLNGFLAVFGEGFAALNNAILDPHKTNTSRVVSAKGGENVEDVWDQPEENEYIYPLPGYFTIPCKFPPVLRNFDVTDFKSTLAKTLRCHGSGENNSSVLLTNSSVNSTLGYNKFIPGMTIAIKRYEYANFYHAMTDIYNAFVLELLLSKKGESVNILFLDAHPKSKLDFIWSSLFGGKVMRAGRLSSPVKFEKLVWGMQGYSSPLNSHHSITVPYLEEFRHFFLTSHGVNIKSTNHVRDCRRLKVLVIWRHDHVTHPRNKQGKVVRKFSNENEILEVVRDTLSDLTPTLRHDNASIDRTVLGVDLETMDMKEQLSLISNCDILIGMHGAGLSHVLFLPKTSGLLEILPSYSSPDLIHFQSMARWRGVAYERWHNVERAMDKDNSETYVKLNIMRMLVKYIHRRVCPRA